MNIRHQIIAVIGLCIAGCSGSDSARNRAPSISAIADQATMANAPSAAIVFTVTDEQASNLSITVSSDRQTVIPDSGIVLTGIGTARSLTVTPVIDTLGDAFVTIIVTDRAGLSASTSFLVNVIPQQASMLQFTRASFEQDEADDPQLVNAIEFDQDAADDDFADLLAQ